MASNQLVTTAVKPLSMMKKLSPFVYIYEPESIVAPTTTRLRVPKLIFVASWMDAQDLHIAKYITRYQAIYPTSKIVLAKFVYKESMSPSLAREVVEPAFTFLRSELDAGFLSASPSEPEILMGLFRLIATPFVTTFVTCLWIVHAFRFIIGENFMAVNWRVLNDLDLVKQTNRSYIYGKADVMVDWRHVEIHAKEAAVVGLDVRTELFEGSPHVSHMRSDGERYWRIVTETWERAIAAQ
ncbi:hypothetical protein Daesc_002550 [Daldinia eschscholtzii]|uniref:Indole-diterpene biosynthesis protein PaxU n=1 Tax=Daldinia eschscholtzii TaxID=292717 RepID=A0AAX6MRW5_9PEZI